MSTVPHRLFVWRTFTSVLLAACFAGAVFSGAILFLSPPGRIANWTDWNIGGLTKQEWAALHVSFSAVFLIVALFHVGFNWRPLVGYFKDRVSRRLGWRREWVAAVVVAGVVGWAAVADLPPFGWLVAAGERLKQSWDRPAARAPIPHAELLTLGELAARANVEPAAAAERLDRAGIRGHSPEVVVEELARANGVSAQRLYEILQGRTGGPGRGGGGAGRGGEGGGGRGAGGAGHGGGVGWKTLEQLCAEEGLAVPEVLGRLQARGVQAEAGQTLREIANANGYDRPFELVELIRGTAK